MTLGIYIHIPFCRLKCPYCDFNTYAGISDLIPTYMRALEAELELRLESWGGPGLPDTVFFGGGTPSLVPGPDIARLLSRITERTGQTPSEITLEVNPGTIDDDGLAALMDAGVNRLSVGCQTFQQHLLSSLGRLHTVADSLRTLDSARTAGFNNLSLDLMYGLSGQSIQDWERDLQVAQAQGVPHVSLYNLTIEEGTPFARLKADGQLPLPDEDVQKTMYELAVQRSGEAGLQRYEISNFARPDYECRHNRIYWDSDSWLALGAGAHGFQRAAGAYGRRWWNLRNPRRYIDCALGGTLPEDGFELLDRKAAMTEELMLGLRVREGLQLDRFFARFDADAIQLLQPALAEMQAAGKVEVDGGAVHLTEPSGIIADYIISRLARMLDRAPSSGIVTPAIAHSMGRLEREVLPVDN